MRFPHYLLSLFLLGLCLNATTGCGGSGQPEVAPRTQSEIEAYKEQAYGAEEEMDAEEDEDE
jgi:hypothetical protein